MENKMPQKILCVCMGNICRSPTAEGCLRVLLEQRGQSKKIIVDSCGTHADWHKGESPDPRSIQAALERKIDISSCRARPILQEDFLESNYILVMDQKNFEDVLRICPTQYQHKVFLFLSFLKNLEIKEVPDPYSLDKKAFENVLDLIWKGAISFLNYAYPLDKLE